MKKNLLKSIVALLLVASLFALASCAEISSLIDQVEDAIENGESNNQNNENNEQGNENNEQGNENNEQGNENGEQGNENETVVDAFAVTFVTDENSSVTVYATQDMTGDNGVANATKTYALDKETGLPTKVEEAGQVNFVVVLAEGYEIDSVSVTPTDGYNKLKGGVAETGVETGYRITKITADLTVTVTTKAAGAAENLENGYAVTFIVDEHASVTVFKTQDMTAEGEENATVAYSRNSTTGDLTKDGKGQVNFLVVVEEGYEIAAVTAMPTENYNNLKGFEDTGVENGYRLTKITGEVTVTVTVKSATAE